MQSKKKKYVNGTCQTISPFPVYFVAILNRFYIWMVLFGFRFRARDRIRRPKMFKLKGSQSQNLIYMHIILYGTVHIIVFYLWVDLSTKLYTYYTTLNTIYAHIWVILFRMGSCAQSPRVLWCVYSWTRLCVALCVSVWRAKCHWGMRCAHR